jgi:hypothetical protein
MTRTPIIRTVVLLAQTGIVEKATLLDNVKTVVDILGTAVTAAAVILGGIWAYFKFVKGRTYRPRLGVDLAGEWRLVDGRRLFHARITVENIGASKVTLLQRGTGLRVSVLAQNQPVAPAAATWEHLKVFEILEEHQWIEPGETVSDDLLLNLGILEPAPTLLEARLVWKWSKRSGNIVVMARQVNLVNSRMDENKEGAAVSGNQGGRNNP